MTNNEERIWDVLIEDALRESGAPAPMHEMGDRTRRLLQPVGPMGVDRGRSMRYTRHRWVRITAGTLAVVLVLTILYLGVALLPMLSEANHEHPQSAEGNQSPVHQEAGESTPPAPDQQPTETEQPVETPEPEPQPEDTPKQPEPKPEDTVEQPKPEPKPEDTVEQPKPEPKPEDTVEQPKPEPKPEDTVEQPKQPDNSEPEDHETVPVVRPQPGMEVRLLRAEPGANLLVANAEYSDTGQPAYRTPKDESVFAHGSWFKTKKPVDLEVKGVLLRLDGEFRVEIYFSVLWLQHRDGALFIDNRGTNQGAYLQHTEQEGSLTLGSGMALFEASSSSLDITVYEGRALYESGATSEEIAAGKRCTLRKSELGALKDVRRTAEEEPFLKGLNNRVVYRENFDADPEGRLRAGKLLDGVITGGTVFWGYPVNISYEPGLVLRLRVRFTNAMDATLTQFCEERNDNYSFELSDFYSDWFHEPGEPAIPNGKWLVLDVPVDQFLERTKHEGHPQEGESFMNVSITTQGENAQVELDWVELIRAVK